MAVSDELGQRGLWDALETIYASAQKAGAQETLALLDQLAGGLHQAYGLGPATPETQAAEWQSYTRNVGAMMDRDVPAEIIRAFGPQFSAVAPANRQELIKAAGLEMQEILGKDRALASALQKLNQAYSVKEGVRIYFDVVEPRVRATAQRVARKLTAQYGDLFKGSARFRAMPQPAPKTAQPVPEKPRSMAEATAKGMSLGDILRSELGQQDEANPLGVEEARRMSDADILNSPRIGQRRTAWKPGNELDE
jgi:hypothetical protein